MDIINTPIPENQQVALAEAALIRYFRPEYNIIYKDSFTNEDLKLLEECYNLDFVGLAVEINTEDLRAPLWSQTVNKGVHHHRRLRFA